MLDKYKAVVIQRHVMSIIMLYVCLGVKIIFPGLLLGVTLVLGLRLLPHHLTQIIGFSTVLRHSSNLGSLEVEQTRMLARVGVR
jgi:hypothetical protein